MAFAYEALDFKGNEISSVIDGASEEEVTHQLHAQGLFVTSVTKLGDAEEAHSDRIDSGAPDYSKRGGSSRDRMLFTQQMAMMLRAGSQVVPALTAIASQAEKDNWQSVVNDICGEVKNGRPLSGAMASFPEVFDQTFRAIVAAGESTGDTSEAFERLSVMTRKQQGVRMQVLGAMVYPIVLLTLCLGVVCVLFFYVLPKFDALYSMLGAPLPTITQFLLFLSKWALANVIEIVIGVVVFVAGAIVFFRHPISRSWFGAMIFRIPIINILVSHLILARIFRVWGVLVRSNVPLLEGIELSRASTNNAMFLSLLDTVQHAVQDGESIGGVLGAHPLVPATMASAIATGEQSGQLDISLLFLADYLDEENEQMLTTLTRLLEPVILVLMGLIVGVMAVALFLPLFDLTSAISGGR